MKRKREQRIAVWEARVDLGEGLEPRSPEEVLQAAAKDADDVLQMIKARVRDARAAGDGSLDLDLLGPWLDRASRLSRTVLDAGILERRTQIAESQGQVIAALIRRILDQLDLSDAQRTLVGVVVPEELRALSTGEAPAPRPARRSEPEVADDEHDDDEVLEPDELIDPPPAPVLRPVVARPELGPGVWPDVEL